MDSTVLLTSEALSSVVTQNSNAVVSSTSTTDSVVLDQPTIVTVEIEKTQAVISLGARGPDGSPGLNEEDIVYSKRTDFTTDNTLYKGEAVVGSPEASSVWRIRYISLSADGDVTEVWAAGDALFNKVWANRAAYTYS